MNIASDLFFLNLSNTPVKSNVEIVNYLGQNLMVLDCYMNHFSFVNMSLLTALRALSTQLPLRGETQNIDRVLLQFVKRYISTMEEPKPFLKEEKRWRFTWFKEQSEQELFQLVPQNLLEKTLHVVVFSLVLLNTDLQTENFMTKSEFVLNTSLTLKKLHKLDFSNFLQQQYDQIKLFALNQQKRQNSLFGFCWMQNSFSSISSESINITPLPDSLLFESLKRKHLLSFNKRASSRGWHKCVMQLTMESLVFNQEIHSPSHCVAFELDNSNEYNYVIKYSFVWGIRTSNAQVWLFRAESRGQMMKCIDAINLRAAFSSLPSVPVSSNQKYGWEKEYRELSVWTAPGGSCKLSTLSNSEQYLMAKQQLENTILMLNNHNKQKQNLKTDLAKRNFKQKELYLIQERQKWSIYLTHLHMDPKEKNQVRLSRIETDFSNDFWKSVKKLGIK